MTEPHPFYADPTGPELMPLRPPDVVLGTLSLWIEGAQGPNGWLDVVVYVGDHFQTLMHTRGPLIRKPDLIAFGSALAELVDHEEAEACLPAIDFSLGLHIKRRRPPGGSFCTISLRSCAGDQMISIHCDPARFGAAAEGVQTALDRLAGDRGRAWTPAILSGPAEARERLTRLVGPVGSNPAPDQPTRPVPPPRPPIATGPDPEFEFSVHGLGWHGLVVRVGDAMFEAGGSDVGDGLDSLIRAGLMLASGAHRAEVVFNGEPTLTRIEFESAYRAGDAPPFRPCVFRVHEQNHDTAPATIEFEAVCDSALGVAQALYRMALPHFLENDRADRHAFAALEGALLAIETVREHDAASGRPAPSP